MCMGVMSRNYLLRKNLIVKQLSIVLDLMREEYSLKLLKHI